MSKKYGLVLAGGGSKGAYQMGSWKALKELEISFEAIAGVSIGSVNGALIAMGDYENAIKFWDSIAVDKGVRIEEKLVDPDNLFSKKNWPALFREIWKNKGLDASPAKDFFSEYIDESKVRKSGIDFGLVTIKLGSDGATPMEVLLKDIPNGQLIDYLLASADIPLAINIGPDGDKFLDGGTYDNTPVSFLKKNGYNRLVVVDIASIRGVAHATENNYNSEIVYIRPYNLDDLGASFDFSSQMNEKRAAMGYMDTKKAFSALLGNIYYFSPETFRSMAKKYGADAVKQLEEFAYDNNVERLKVYEEDEFIAVLKPVYDEYLKNIEDAEKKQKEEKKNYFSDILEKLSIQKSQDNSEDSSSNWLYTYAGKILNYSVEEYDKYFGSYDEKAKKHFKEMLESLSKAKPDKDDEDANEKNRLYSYASKLLSYPVEEFEKYFGQSSEKKEDSDEEKNRAFS